MSKLHFIKASDVNYDYCFLEVFQNNEKTAFMDIRISEDRKMSYFIYSKQSEFSLTPDEWLEIHTKSLSFYKKELENEDAFREKYR